MQKAADKLLDEQDADIIPALRARLKARQQELNAVKSKLEAIEARPVPTADLEAGVDAAVAMVTKLAASVRSEDAAELQAVLQEWVSYVEVWFRQVPHKKGPRNHFARGLVFVREDVRLTTLAYSAPSGR